MQRLPIKVFISSPGDVEQERVITSRIIKRLADRYSDKVQLSGIFWEHEPLRATDTFQRQIVPPSQTDIAVCILWARLGTRLPKDITREDGSRYDSGTEFEFEDAFLSQKKSGIPDLLVYRKTSEPLVSLTNEQELLQRIEQKRALDKFIDKWFISEDGSLTAAFHPFETGAQFEEIFEIHLSKLIEQKIEQAGITLGASQAAPIETTWQGNPFRGLEVFEYEHADIFFGRTRAIEDIINQLRKQDQKGTPVITVLGMSGSGKSSVIRAGVVPLITKPGVIEGISEWRRAYLKPSDMNGDLIHALAVSLCAEPAIPELNESEHDFAELKELLQQQPAAAAQKVVSELKFLGKQIATNEIEKLTAQKFDGIDALQQQYKDNPPKVNLLLVIDQLEELFTQASLDDAKREYFIDLLDALCRTRKVWIISSLRSDFYANMSELKNFESLRKGEGQIDLYPPTPNEIYQMIRLPALAAGLGFDENHDTGERLDDCLRDAASKEDGSLPVLQFSLAELYKRRGSNNRLTFHAYHEMGGLEGALASSAEKAFNSLDPTSQQSFNQIFRRLVNVSAIGDKITKASCLASKLNAFTGAQAFIDAFVERRLFIVDQDDRNQPIVSVAHEALLRAWPRIKSWLEKDRELLQVKSRFEFSCSQWLAADKKSELLLNEGKPLDEAILLINEQLPLSDAQQDFIQASLKKKKSKIRLRQLAVLTLGMLTLMASIAAYYATEQQQLAELNEAFAEQAKISAQESEQLSQYRLSQVFTQQGIKANEALDYKRSALLFGAAWQHNKSATNEYLLASAIRQLKSEVVLDHLQRKGGAVLAFSPNQEYLVVSDQAGQIEIWSTKSKTLLHTVDAHLDVITKIVFSRNSQQFFTASADNQIKLISISGEQKMAFTKHFGAVFDIQLSKDESHLLSIGYENNAILWNTLSGELLSRISFSTAQDIRLGWLTHDANQAYTVSSNGQVTLWQLASPKAIPISQCDLPASFTAGQMSLVAQLPGIRNVISDGKAELYSFDCKVRNKNEPVNFSDANPSLYYEFDEHANLLEIVDFANQNANRVITPDRAMERFASDESHSRLVFANTDGDVFKYQHRNEQIELQFVSQGFQRSLADIKVSKLGDYGAAVDNQGYLRLFDWSTQADKKEQSVAAPLLRVFERAHYIIDVTQYGELVIHDIHNATLDERVQLNEEALVRDVELSRDGRFLLILQNDLTIWDRQQGEYVTTLASPDTSHAWTHVEVLDEQSFVIASSDGDAANANSQLLFYSFRDFSLLRESTGWAESVSALSSFREGYYLLGLAQQNLQLWFAKTGKLRFTVDSNVSDYSISPDGHKIAVGYNDGRINLMRHTRSVLTEFNDEGRSAHLSRINFLRWSPDQQWLLSADLNGEIKVWNAQTSLKQSELAFNLTPVQSSKNPTTATSMPLIDAIFSSDSRYLLLNRNNQLSLFDPISGTKLMQRSFSAIAGVYYDANLQKYIVRLVNGESSAIELPQLVDVQVAINQTIKQAIPWGFAREKIRPNDEWLALALLVLDEANDASQVATRGASYLQKISQFVSYLSNDQVTQIAHELSQLPNQFKHFSDGRFFKGYIEQQLEGLQFLLTSHSERIEDATFNPHQQQWITADWDGNISQWNESGTLKALSVTHSFDNLTVHPSNNWLLGASFQFGSKVWNLDSGRELLNLPLVTRSVMWSPSGDAVIGTDQLNNVYRYDLQGKLLDNVMVADAIKDERRLRIDDNGNIIIAFNSDNVALFKAGSQQPIWDKLADDLSDIANSEINDVVLSADGKTLWLAMKNLPLLQVSDLQQATPKIERLNVNNVTELYLNQNETQLIVELGEGFALYPLGATHHSAIDSVPLSEGYMMQSSRFNRLTSNLVALKNEPLGLMIFDSLSGDQLGATHATGKGYSRAFFSPDSEQLLIVNGEGRAALFALSKMNKLGFSGLITDQHSVWSMSKSQDDDLQITAVAGQLPLTVHRWQKTEGGWTYQALRSTISKQDNATSISTEQLLASFVNDDSIWQFYSNGVVKSKLNSNEIGPWQWQSLPREWLEQLKQSYVAEIDDSRETDEQTEPYEEDIDEWTFEPASGYAVQLIKSATASPRGEFLATVWVNNQITLLSRESVMATGTSIAVDCQDVRRVVWYSDDLLGIECNEQEVLMYSTRGLRLVGKLEIHLAAVIDAKYHPATQQLVYANLYDGRLHQLDTNTGQELVFAKSLGIIRGFAFDAHHGRYAIANDDGQIQIYRSDKSTIDQVFKVSNEPISQLGFFVNGDFIVGLTDAGNLLVVDAESGTLMRKIRISDEQDSRYWFVDVNGAIGVGSSSGALTYVNLFD